MDYLQQANEVFSNDRFATQTTGIVIDEVGKGFAKCHLKIEDKHLNAGNMVMGGAIFTLADFAFGVAANADNPATVTMNASISYLNAAKGDTLIADAHCVKSGRSTCVVEVGVYDNLGIQVATAVCTGFRKS